MGPFRRSGWCWMLPILCLAPHRSPGQSHSGKTAPVEQGDFQLDLKTRSKDMMRSSIKQCLFTLSLVIFLTAIGGAVFAAPTEVTISPYNGARFLPGQRFDLRVEGRGTGPFSATLSIDGDTQRFTSGEQNTA